MVFVEGFVSDVFIRLYMAGIDIQPLRLSTNTSNLFPVPTGTPMISPFVDWDHSEIYAVPTLQQLIGSSGGAGGNVGNSSGG